MPDVGNAWARFTRGDFRGATACLDPEEADRHVMTASQWQVKQPINTNSVGRWRRYEEWLQPLIASLGGLAWVEDEHRDMTSLAA